MAALRNSCTAFFKDSGFGNRIIGDVCYSYIYIIVHFCQYTVLNMSSEVYKDIKNHYVFITLEQAIYMLFISC